MTVSLLTIYLHHLLPCVFLLALGVLVIVDIVPRVDAMLGLFL